MPTLDRFGSSPASSTVLTASPDQVQDPVLADLERSTSNDVYEFDSFHRREDEYRRISKAPSDILVPPFSPVVGIFAKSELAVADFSLSVGHSFEPYALRRKAGTSCTFLCQD